MSEPVQALVGQTLFSAARSTRSAAVAIMAVCTIPLMVAGCRRGQPQTGAAASPAAARSAQDVPRSLAMGGAKSRMTIFVTSVGLGRGGNLGGLAGADARCQALATKEGAGDHTWRAYLSTTATTDHPAVNARDRIGVGPWYNAEAELVAANLDALHGASSRISKETALTEKGDPVKGVGDEPVQHDVLTGSRSDGTAFPTGDDLTCANWTSSEKGRAQVGHHDGRAGRDDPGTSWNSAHASRGCSPEALERSGAGLFYCFAID